MAALIPVTQPTNVEAAYEDMFKEITRKLYGEETGNGLHTLGTPVAHVATSGPTVPEGERSFTTLMSDRSMAPPIEYDHNGGSDNPASNNFKSEDHLTTAFGLAALMHNGFQTSGTILNTQPIQKTANNISIPSSVPSNSTVTNNPTVSAVNSSTEGRWNPPSQDIMSWSSSGKLASFNGNQKNSKVAKNKEQTNEVYQDPVHSSAQTTQTANRKAKPVVNQNTTATAEQVPKRYNCTHCPYSTDRRDLFTRHENIHKDEKPFQCYACLKQFNRADHVKKHFLRMHRELSYDINKTRRSVVNEQKPNIFSQNTNNNQQSGSEFLNTQRRTVSQEISQNIAQTIESVATAQIAGHSIPMKQEKDADEKVVTKIKREKRFSCCYCPWSGADKWGLKRHLNTHTKPFVCMLCDYKAARSERLATHVLKVHNKKACNKCSFLADSQEQYQAHLNEVHPHDQRPPRSNSSNVLRTIGNTLVTNNQISFQNPTVSFGNIQTSNSGVAIYTTQEVSSNNTNTNAMQELVVNPSSMVAWRLSASGSLIPPPVQGSSANEQPSTTTGNSNQKRGAERLFQYLEADGSDPEDYARQLKMEAISRNTASVAQDFHNAGGVEKQRKTILPKANQIEMEKYLLTSAGSVFCNNTFHINFHKKKAMSLNSTERQSNLKFTVESPPAFTNLRKVCTSKGHRLNLTHQNKENSNSFITDIDSRLNKFGFHFHNYVKEFISKLYPEITIPGANNFPNQEKDVNSYLEYLQRKGDITYTISEANKEAAGNKKESTCISVLAKRSRKQAQPKKIAKRNTVSVLREKYMKRLVDKRKECAICIRKRRILTFPYHTIKSLLLHRLWRHSSKIRKCRLCTKTFTKLYSLKIHFETHHRFTKKKLLAETFETF